MIDCLHQLRILTTDWSKFATPVIWLQ